MNLRPAVLYAAVLLGFGAPLNAAAATSGATLAQARAACMRDDFDGFLRQMATSAAVRRVHVAPWIEVVEQDARGPGAPKVRTRRVPGARFGDFPLAMDNHHYVRAHAGRTLRDASGRPYFLAITTERQTATLTDYPVPVVNVSWQQIRYGAPPRGQHEGEVLGYYGNSGRLLFAAGRDGCWQLINVMVTRRGDALRPPVAG